MSRPHFAALRSVSKAYRRGDTVIDVLRDISFSVAEGEFALVCGPSGSGKTTLLNLIAGLDRPDTGKIIIAGRSIAGLSLAAAARYRSQCIGFVFQSYNLLPQLTALENVLLPMIPRPRWDRRGRSSCSIVWDLPGGILIDLPSSAAASSNVSRSPEHSRMTPRSYSRTNPPEIWTSTMPIWCEHCYCGPVESIGRR